MIVLEMSYQSLIFEIYFDFYLINVYYNLFYILYFSVYKILNTKNNINENGVKFFRF